MSASTSGNSGTVAAAAGVVVHSRFHHLRRFGHFLVTWPFFIFVLALYVTVLGTVKDVNHVYNIGGNYQITWAQALLFVAFMVAIFELLKVATPGADETWDAMLMVGVAASILVIFVLSVALTWAGIRGLAFLDNTEFLLLLLISSVQAGFAIVLNARTLKRSIAYSGEHN